MSLFVNFHPFPELTTARLRLRRITPADVQEIFFLRSDSRVLRYLDREPATSTADALQHIDIVESLIQQNTGINWGIQLLDDPTLIGQVSIWKIDKPNYRGTIGYVLHPSFHRKGILHEALGAVIHYGFREMGLHSLEANVNPANEASIRLLEKNGFTREAYFRENHYFNGEFLDSAIYSLISPFRHDNTR